MKFLAALTFTVLLASPVGDAWRCGFQCACLDLPKGSRGYLCTQEALDRDCVCDTGTVTNALLTSPGPDEADVTSVTYSMPPDNCGIDALRLLVQMEDNKRDDAIYSVQAVYRSPSSVLREAADDADRDALWQAAVDRVVESCRGKVTP